MPNAIVTGATQGIGKAIAEKLLAEGFSIAVCARDKNKLQAVQNEWNEKYPLASIVIYRADLSIKEEAAAFGDMALSTFPEIDLLVNNAGTYLPGTIAERTGWAFRTNDWRKPVQRLPPYPENTAGNEKE